MKHMIEMDWIGFGFKLSIHIEERERDRREKSELYKYTMYVQWGTY